MDHGTAEHDPTSDLLDEDGRPVGEIGSRRYDPEATELVQCPYADARQGNPMNHTALRQLSTVWPEVLRAAGALAGPTPTAHGAWRACIAGTRAPALHHHRYGTPVPRLLSALYKSSLGFSQVLTALLLSEPGLADVPLASLGTPDAFFALLDRERWLVGADQVCAGPRPMIEQMFEALATGGTASTALEGLAPLAPWIDQRTEWIGVQVAFIGAVQDLARTRQLPHRAWRKWVQPGLPCLRSVLARPGRSARHATRLFPSGGSPARVLAFLDQAPSTLEGLADHRARTLA